MPCGSQWPSNPDELLLSETKAAKRDAKVRRSLGGSLDVRKAVPEVHVLCFPFPLAVSSQNRTMQESPGGIPQIPDAGRILPRHCRTVTPALAFAYLLTRSPVLPTAAGPAPSASPRDRVRCSSMQDFWGPPGTGTAAARHPDRRPDHAPTGLGLRLRRARSQGRRPSCSGSALGLSGDPWLGWRIRTAATESGRRAPRPRFAASATTSRERSAASTPPARQRAILIPPDPGDRTYRSSGAAHPAHAPAPRRGG